MLTRHARRAVPRSGDRQARARPARPAGLRAVSLAALPAGLRAVSLAALPAGLCAVSLAAFPAAHPGGAAAVPLPAQLRAAAARQAAADAIRDNQRWVLDMMDVPAAWRSSLGAGVTVAVLDSGVDPDVSDLAGSVITGPDYTGTDTSPSSPDWGMHGTWMASLIAGHGHGPGDASGIIGVAPRARILSVRVIPDRSDPHYAAYQREQEPRIQRALADGIDYAVRHGAGVISMSIGYSAPSRAVRAALLNAYDHGVVLVASAGNSGSQAGAPSSFPADYPGVIGVGAVDEAGAVAGFSSDNLSVQVAAPGVSVPAQGRDGRYWWVSGTSPACALVAGAAALIRSAYPGLPPDLVVSALTSTTTGRPRRGYDPGVGFGTVDAAAALARAGELSRALPPAAGAAGSAAPGGVAGSAAFGGGRSAVPPAPVRPRGAGPLVLFAVLALASLALAGAAGSRLAVLSRTRHDPRRAGPGMTRAGRDPA
jgi:subtilisin family serine protease